jgi:NADH dehydrogenase
MPNRPHNPSSATTAADGQASPLRAANSLTATATHATDPRPHVVIVGGGFAGLSAARALANAPVRITLLDRTNHHLFQPLLYQVATAVLNPADISVPIRWLLRKQQNATVVMADVDRIDPHGKTVSLDSGTVLLSFDYLLLATGARHAYFGHAEWEQHAPGHATPRSWLALGLLAVVVVAHAPNLARLARGQEPRT